MVAIEAQGITYRRSGQALVQRATFRVDRGEFLALVGAPGSGTNTLLRILAGELAPDEGRVLVDGSGRRVTGCSRRTDPRRIVLGCSASEDALAFELERSILLLDRPIAGISCDRAERLLGACRDRAVSGAAVIATVDDPWLAARHAHTLLVLVAGG